MNENKTNINWLIGNYWTYHVADAIESIFEILRACNKYIDDTIPWSLAKDETKKERLGTVLYNLLDAIRITSILLFPFMPETSLKVFKSLNTNNNTYDKVATGNMESNIKLGESEVLFKRIEEKK